LVEASSIQTFKVLGNYNREGPGIEVDGSLPALLDIRAIEQIIE